MIPSCNYQVKTLGVITKTSKATFVGGKRDKDFFSIGVFTTKQNNNLGQFHFFIPSDPSGSVTGRARSSLLSNMIKITSITSFHRAECKKKSNKKHS